MTWFIILLLLLLLVLLLYFSQRPKDARIFQKMGIGSPPGLPILGHLGHPMKHGIAGSQMMFYNMYKDKKVFGIFEGPKPNLYVKDLDMLREIFIKSFSSFPDRRHILKFDPPMHENLLMLKGDTWKHVRSTVSPIFSSSHMKKLAKHVEGTTKHLMESLQEKQEKNEEVNLKDAVATFTLDVIARTGFGIDLDSFKNPNSDFIVKAKKAIQIKTLQMTLMILFPRLSPVFALLGLNIMNMESVRYLVKSVDAMIQEREGCGQMSRYDFLDLLIHAKNEEGKSAKGMLTETQIQGVALNFLFAGFDTVSNAISLTLFMLAHHPQCVQAVQEEIDSKIGAGPINYDNIQELSYLEMCINETMRLYPAILFLDRECVKTTTIQDVVIPEGMGIIVPIYAIHHDPDLWPDPETFKPERFTPEAVAARNPFSFIPFGHGPRNCIGMRLGLLESKMAVASILQQFTPLPCSKTIYPIVLINSIFPLAKDGLWVKLEARQKR